MVFSARCMLFYPVASLIHFPEVTRRISMGVMVTSGSNMPGGGCCMLVMHDHMVAAVVGHQAHAWPGSEKAPSKRTERRIINNQCL
jgi:hypothetical protein